MRVAQTQVEFVVTITLEGNVAAALIQGYVEEAILGWQGQYVPEDEMFGLDKKDVNVKLIGKSKRYKHE